MRFAVRTILLVLAAGASLAAEGQTPRLTGTITYRERVALASTAVVEVRLDDVSTVGAVPPVVATTKIERAGQVPIRFELPYDARAIDPRGRYAVRATISDGGVLLFSSLDTALVLTQGHGLHADLVLTHVAGAVAPPPPPPQPMAPPLPPDPFVNLPATFIGTLPCADCESTHVQLNLFSDDSFVSRMTYTGKTGEPVDDMGSWALSSDRRVLVLKGRGETVQTFAVPSASLLKKLDADGNPLTGRLPPELTRASAFRPLATRLPMRGLYSVTGEARMFVECSTGQTFGVAAAGARELDAAYPKARSATGAAVLAEIEGALTPQSKPANGGMEMVLTVEKFLRVLPRESCGRRFTSAPLGDTFWRLTRLDDQVIPAATDPRRELSITFQAGPRGTGAFSGSTACNRLIGTYRTANAVMEITTGGTLRACKDDAATEAAFVAALKATKTYRIAGRTLELMDAAGKTVARFEARTAAGITRR